MPSLRKSFTGSEMETTMNLVDGGNSGGRSAVLTTNVDAFQKVIRLLMEKILQKSRRVESFLPCLPPFVSIKIERTWESLGSQGGVSRVSTATSSTGEGTKRNGEQGWGECFLVWYGSHWCLFHLHHGIPRASVYFVRFFGWFVWWGCLIQFLFRELLFDG